MKRPLFAAFALGAITVAGFAPVGFSPLPMVTLALLFRAWQRAATPGQAAALGFAWGLGFFLTGVSWVYVSLSGFGDMAPPLAALATLLFCAFLALFPALAGFVFARLRCGSTGRDALLAAGSWALAEWLRGWMFTGFPWLALGYAQTPPSPLAGYAPVLGVYGVGFVAALIAATLASGASRRRMAVTLAVLVGGGLLLRGVAWTQPSGVPVSVSLLQGNIPLDIKWEPRLASLSLDTYVDLALRHPAALTVLPETAIPLFLDDVPRELFADLTRNGAVLFGVAMRLRQDGSMDRYTNGAVAVTRRGDGEFDFQTYAKRHLVPFGEFGPPGFAWFFDLVRIPLSDFTAGPPGQKPLAVAGLMVAPNICYEDLFGDEIIEALPAASVLVNLSNTAWFGDSLAQPQHLQISRMRAMETGRPSLRATNTGMTAAIAPDGSIIAALEPFGTGALVLSVQGYSGTTPFVRYGNVVAVILALAACLPALRRRRGGRDSESEVYP